MAINFKDGVILGMFNAFYLYHEKGIDDCGIQAQTVEPRLEHTLRTELQTSLLKSTIPSGAVDLDLLRTLKLWQTSFTINWECTES